MTTKIRYTQANLEYAMMMAANEPDNAELRKKVYEIEDSMEAELRPCATHGCMNPVCEVWVRPDA